MPILKKKVLLPNKRPVFQLFNAMRLNDKGILNLNKTTAKTHSMMDKKIFIPLYAKYLHFLLTRCGWQESLRKILWLWTKFRGTLQKPVLRKIFISWWITLILVMIAETTQAIALLLDCLTKSKNSRLQKNIKMFSTGTYLNLFLQSFWTGK